jgi:HPt (histidine-containing phosphotransfer) domain-containing protein
VQFDLARLRLLGDLGTDEGRQWLLEVVDAYIVDTRTRYAQVMTALERENPALVQALAHQQKGVSAMLGAEGPAGHFRAIEECPGDRAVVHSHLSAILEALDRLDDEIQVLTASPPSE